VPAVNFVGIDTKQHGEQSKHHQSLNVVRIGVIDQLADTLWVLVTLSARLVKYGLIRSNGPQTARRQKDPVGRLPRDRGTSSHPVGTVRTMTSDTLRLKDMRLVTSRAGVWLGAGAWLVLLDYENQGCRICTLCMQHTGAFPRLAGV